MIEALDTKAGVLIAANGVVLALLAGGDGSLERAPAVATLAIIGAVAVSLISALLSFTTRKYETAPNPDAAIHLMTAEYAWLEWRFLGVPIGGPHRPDCRGHPAGRILLGERGHDRSLSRGI